MAEPRFLEVLRPRYTPKDPHFDRQWQWYNNGSNGGMIGADAGLTQAWDTTFGEGIKLAVVDNGFDIHHPDLKNRRLHAAYYQDDGMGDATLLIYHDGDQYYPDCDHGTFCAGLAGAQHNNGKGGCGAAPMCDLIFIACMTDQIGSQDTLARAIAYAANPSLEDGSQSPKDGADVISCSLGPNGANWKAQTVLRDAITYAANSGRGGKGSTIFWAVNNHPTKIKLDDVCAHSDTIAVGRSNRLDLADDSAYGPELDFLAPGVDVYSTKSGARYGLDTGTSYAAPIAAGIGALVIAKNPNFTRQEVRNRLHNTCAKIGYEPYRVTSSGPRNDRYGFGRIDAGQAVF